MGFWQTRTTTVGRGFERAMGTMQSGLIDRAKEGVKTREGKTVAILLLICLLLVVWNVGGIGWAVSHGEDAKGGVSQKGAVTVGNGTDASTRAGSDRAEGAQPVAGGKVSGTTTQIRYNPNGGDGAIASQTVKANEPVVISSGDGLSREGYTLAGWSFTEGEDNQVDFELGDTAIATAEDEESNVLHAVWVENEDNGSSDASSEAS